VTPAKTGGISIENTHPFYQGKWIFADDGTMPEFDLVRPLIPAHTELKWSGEFGQRAKMYPTLMNGYGNDEETELFRQV
jgi:predicted glutamine amidotransferase